MRTIHLGIAIILLLNGCKAPVDSPRQQELPAPAAKVSEVERLEHPVEHSRPSVDAVDLAKVIPRIPEEAAEADPTPVLEADNILAPVALLPAPESAAAAESEADDLAQRAAVARLCEEVGNKLGSVSVADCLQQNLAFGGGWSVEQRALAQRDFIPSSGGKARILVLGGVHGDEYSSVSIMFKWMNLLKNVDQTDYHWRFLPLVNPDGLLAPEAVRQNANGVDLNRNFPTDDWEDTALQSWRERTGSNPRRYPGRESASEPEVRWVVEQIKSFQPDVIVSVHAPYHLLDFDGPTEPPEKIGELYLHQLGVYPGSLGNYGGLNLGIQVVTMELESAGIMPAQKEIAAMWSDLAHWLETEAVAFIGAKILHTAKHNKE